MDNRARVRLVELAALYGELLRKDPELLESLLHETCPGCGSEISVLLRSLEAGVPAILQSLGAGNPVERARIERDLQVIFGLSGEASRWAIESWAQAVAQFPNARDFAKSADLASAAASAKAKDREASALLALPVALDSTTWRSAGWSSPHREVMIAVAGIAIGMVLFAVVFAFAPKLKTAVSGPQSPKSPGATDASRGACSALAEAAPPRREGAATSASVLQEETAKAESSPTEGTRLEQARAAFKKAQDIENSAAAAAGLKVKVWRAYVDDFIETGYRTAEAREHLAQWQSNSADFADYTESAAGAGIGMIWVSEGIYEMGSSELEPGRQSHEGPVHRVQLRGFWIGKCEITNAQYRAFLQESGYDGSGDADADYLKHFRNADSPHMPDDDSHPVVWVSWNNAKAFCDWLSRKTGASYTLPTEAQWEYACRAGTATSRYWGDTETSLGVYANIADKSAQQALAEKAFAEAWVFADTSDGFVFTAPVGSFKPNAFGLRDMLGNVWEWCSGWYGPYEAKPETDPEGPKEGNARVLRGACWADYPSRCRCAARDAAAPTYTNCGVGFRVVRNPM